MSSLVAFDHCRIPLGHFAFNTREDRVARLHRIALAVDPAAPVRVTPVRRVLARLAWALMSLRQVWSYLRQFGGHVRKAHGVPLFRQWGDAWYCMWRQNQCARQYFWRKLFLVPDRSTWLDNFEHRETNTLLDHLNAGVPATRLTDKLQFHAHCLEHGLPTSPVLAAWETGGTSLIPDPVDPHADVFIKPTTDFGSVGAQAISYHAPTGRYRFEDELLTWPGLLRAIATRRASNRAYLLQRRLRNSAAMSVYGQEDVCNVRIVTGRSLNGLIEPIAGVLRIPSSYTTQGHNRNVLLATVDMADGRLGPGLFRDIRLPQFAMHPDTGHPLDGWRLPAWEQMRELVLRAHATAPWMAFIGWDVVDSDRGLLLLEANANWGGDSVQLPGAPGLGKTRFAEIYLEWFDNVPERGVAPAHAGMNSGAGVLA